MPYGCGANHPGTGTQRSLNPYHWTPRVPPTVSVLMTGPPGTRFFKVATPKLQNQGNPFLTTSSVAYWNLC